MSSFIISNKPSISLCILYKIRSVNCNRFGRSGEYFGVFVNISVHYSVVRTVTPVILGVPQPHLAHRESLYWINPEKPLSVRSSSGSTPIHSASVSFSGDLAALISTSTQLVELQLPSQKIWLTAAPSGSFFTSDVYLSLFPRSKILPGSTVHIPCGPTVGRTVLRSSESPSGPPQKINEWEQ